MSDQNWLSYFGIVTGIAGTIMGCISLRRTDQFKALDLRLELKKEQATLLADVEDLRTLLDKAKNSHTRLASAVGSYQSGGTKHWLDCWSKDCEVTEVLRQEIIVFQTDCSALGHNALETQLVTAHILRRKVEKLRDQYRESLLADDRRRDQLSVDQRILTQSRLESKK